MTIARNRIWNDPITLWGDVVSKSPNKLRPHLNLGASYRDVGNIDGAINEYVIMLRLCSEGINQRDVDGTSYCDLAKFNIAEIMIAMNKLDDAENILVKLEPISEVLVNLGVIKMREDHIDEALTYLLRADQTEPEVIFNEAECYRFLGMCDKAKELYNKVKGWNPNLKIQECIERR